MTETLHIRWLGQKNYHETWLAMQQFTDQRTSETSDELWLLEHPPVYTQGQNGQSSHLLAPTNIEVIKTDRGGQITYHGPGQLMIYTLVDLKRKACTIRQFVRLLEQSIIDYLSEWNVEAYGKCDAPGVYVDGQKIASIGLRVRRFCVYHGIAFNIDMDLAPFQNINPCGFQNLKMAQLRDFAGKIAIGNVAQNLVNYLIRHLVYSNHTWSNRDLLHRV